MITTTPAAPGFRRIDAAQAADLIHRQRSGVLPGLQLFDVRDRASYERSHVAGAEHLTEARLGGVIRRIPKVAPVLIYCYHGNASQAYAEIFADFRFVEVYSVDGGFEPLAAAVAARQGGLRTPAMPADASGELRAFVTRFGFDPDNLDAPREHGLTPLMRAALEGRADLVDELLSCGADPALRNSDGNNALWLACVSKDAVTLRRLIDAGIDVNNRNDLVGATCLMYAASSGRPVLVELLLAAGADPYIRNFDDARAVDLASTIDCLKLLRHTAN